VPMSCSVAYFYKKAVDVSRLPSFGEDFFDLGMIDEAYDYSVQCVSPDMRAAVRAAKVGLLINRACDGRALSEAEGLLSDANKLPDRVINDLLDTVRIRRHESGESTTPLDELERLLTRYASADAASIPPGALHRLIRRPLPRAALKAVSLVDLSAELLARLTSGQTYRTNEEAVLGEQLRGTLAAMLDIHENRFAARRFSDLLRPILAQMKPADLDGATVVDLGCGSLNPLGFSFLLLMLGAERAYAIDLEPIQNIEIAVRALATAAGWLFAEPQRVLDGVSITPEDVLRNLRGFQLPLLSAGNPAGIAPERLQHRVESVYDLSLPDGQADAVFSVSLLEHLDRPEDALESLRRITRPGGLGHHVIDFNDHRIYWGDVKSPFEFLKVESTEPLVHGSNRIRCAEFCSLFERHGFVVEHVETQGPYTAELSEEERAQFVEPYRSMRRENLMAVGARIVVRRA
jgi:SAM-dependent methyltransferase